MAGRFQTTLFFLSDAFYSYALVFIASFVFIFSVEGVRLLDYDSVKSIN